jgi:hypothetical protein
MSKDLAMTTPGNGMKLITLKVTAKELELLTTLASDQLFRREFIDPRMPGYRQNSGDVNLGKALVGRMRLMAGQGAQGAAAATAPAKKTTG